MLAVLSLLYDIKIHKYVNVTMGFLDASGSVQEFPDVPFLLIGNSFCISYQL